MAVSATRYYKAADLYASGGINWTGDTIKAVLLSASYTPNYETHAFLSDLTNTVLSATLIGTTKSVTKVGAGASAKDALKGFDTSGSKVSFTGGATCRYMAIYKDTGTSTTSPLLCLVDFGADQTSTVGFDITPDSTNGWMLVG
jgi:hypothetical protein